MKQVALLFYVGLLGFPQAYSAATPSVPQNCGRRKVEHTELVVSGAPTEPGDWPWHAAIYILRDSTFKYVCGGTLISKNYVLTAAQCVTSRGTPPSPDVVKVVLGKYNLKDGDEDSEEKEINRIIIHEQFKLISKLSNDIALLGLRTEVSFTDYIQPACVWYRGASDLLKTDTIMGTVVGWGYNINDILSNTIQQITMPMVSKNTCIYSNPIFYGKALDDNLFCAGYRNGTSVCNGDTGSAFQVFIPDEEQGGNGEMSGAWYVRGIVSVMLARADAAVCDRNQYAVFTDVAQYIDWIDSHLDD